MQATVSHFFHRFLMFRTPGTSLCCWRNKRSALPRDLKITSHHGWHIRKYHLLPWLEIPFEYIFTWFSLSLCTSKKGGWFFNGDAIIRSKDYTPEIHQELDPWDAPFEDDYWFNSCFWFPYISAIYCQWGDYIYHLIIYHLPPTTY